MSRSIVYIVVLYRTDRETKKTTFFGFFFSVLFRRLCTITNAAFFPGRMRVRPNRSVQQNRIGQTTETRRLLRTRSAVHDHVGGQRTSRGVRVGQFGAQDRIRRRLFYRYVAKMGIRETYRRPGPALGGWRGGGKTGHLSRASRFRGPRA